MALPRGEGRLNRKPPPPPCGSSSSLLSSTFGASGQRSARDQTHIELGLNVRALSRNLAPSGRGFHEMALERMTVANLPTIIMFRVPNDRISGRGQSCTIKYND